MIIHFHKILYTEAHTGVVMMQLHCNMGKDIKEEACI